MKFKVETKKVFGVPLIEYRLLSDEPKPTIFFVHGIKRCKEYVEEYALGFVNRGYNVISLDAYLHGDRKKRGMTDRDLELKYADIVIMTGEDINTLYKNHYSIKPYVDNDNVYVAGISMGGAVAFYTGTIMDDIKGIISVIGNPSFVSFLDYSSELVGVPFPNEERNRLSLFDPLLHYKDLIGKSILMINGTKDRRVPVIYSEELFRKLKEEEYDNIVFKLYDVDHSVDEKMLEDIYEWLDNNTL
ncbi:alpha/beta hydrolase [Mycoplasmatota bacterium WC44]